MKNPNPYFKVKALFAACLLALAMIACMVIAYPTGTACAGQYDVFIPVRTGTGTVTLPVLGTSGTWIAVSGTYPAYYLRTSGSGVYLSGT